MKGKGYLRLLSCYKCGEQTLKQKNIKNPTCYSCQFGYHVSWRRAKEGTHTN